MVVNFRKWMKNSIIGPIPLWGLHRISSKLYSTKLFPTINMRSGYYNITVTEDNRKYTVFTIECRNYEFLRVPFGIHVTPSYFALMINETLKGLDFCFAYWMTLSSTSAPIQKKNILNTLDIYSTAYRQPTSNQNWQTVTSLNLRLISSDIYYHKVVHQHSLKNCMQ